MPVSSTLRLSCVVAVLAAAVGCSRLSPAGFWARYRAESIVDQSSDQGPWGGVRWVHWVAPAPGRFTPAGAERFAASHGWTCQRPVSYSAEQVHAWQSSGKPVFPLPFGPADRPSGNGSAEALPRHIDGASWVVRCESGWIRVEPGSGKETPAFGYIQVDRSGTRMAVYHLWGEI
jgi:hypothetical protein